MGWDEIATGLWKAPYTTKIGVECNAVALALADGGLAVISPPTNHAPGLFDELDAVGRVSALVAPNTGHDAGQDAWQARYPDATVHAPAAAAKAIAKSKPALRPFTSLAELAPRLAEGTTIVELPGTRSGATAVSVKNGDERVLVLDDCMTNLPHLTGPAAFRFAFWLSGSGPGLRRSKLWWLAFAKDKPAVAAALLETWDRLDPTTLVFLHGDDAGADRIGEARAQIATMAR